MLQACWNIMHFGLIKDLHHLLWITACTYIYILGDLAEEQVPDHAPHQPELIASGCEQILQVKEGGSAQGLEILG